MNHEAARRFDMGDVSEAPHPTLPRVETHATTQSVEISTSSATKRTDSLYISKIVMKVD